MRVVAALLAAVLGVGGLSLSLAPPARAAPTTSMLYVADATGDTPQPAADITSATINYWRDSITVTINVHHWTDPATDNGWVSTSPAEAMWALDVNGDGGADYEAILLGDGHRGLRGDVLAGSEHRCNGDGVAVSPGYRLSFPAACIGSPSSVSFSAGFHYGSGPTSANDFAPESGYAAPVSPSNEALSDGGYVTDDWGGMHTYNTGGAPPPAVVSPGPYWPGQNVVRGNAATFGGGFVVDDWGGIHSYKTRAVGNFLPAHDGPYWPGEDVARGIALLPSGTGGYVLDDWGGLHPFAVGDSTAPAVPQGGPYWVGQDVARGVTVLPDGSGGYVVDDWGAFHPFVIPGSGHTMPPKPADGPYWFGQDVVRGVVADAEGNGGYVLDDWGGLHAFSVSGKTGPVPPPEAGPYWPGQDVARGISVVPQDPPPASPPPG